MQWQWTRTDLGRPDVIFSQIRSHYYILLGIEIFFLWDSPSCVGMARNEWCNQPDEIITFSWSVRDGPDQANKKQKIFVLSHQNLISFFFNLLQTLLHQSFPLFQRMSKLQLKIFVDVKGEERVCMEDFLYVQLIIFSHFPKICESLIFTVFKPMYYLFWCIVFFWNDKTKEMLLPWGKVLALKVWKSLESCCYCCPWLAFHYYTASVTQIMYIFVSFG